ncbi:MAG: ribonuclease H-like domain-containing protein [Ignavibacteriales bacterium]|nr:ribonuclease H-like domain-containing protein [Ignavibacteriales bacterium]
MQLDLFATEVYYDIETQRSADEVGWENIHLMRLAVGVTWSALEGFRHWQERDAEAMIQYLSSFDRVISFNGDGFDSRVLSYYGDVSEISRRSFDLLKDLRNRLGHRLSLDSIARATLNVGKTANGLQSLQWWREGRIDLITAYCEQDVRVLVDIVCYARSHGFVKYADKMGGPPLTVYVHW